MLKRKDFDKMTPEQQKVFLELVGNYQVKITKAKSQQKRISDLPLFASDNSEKTEELFD